MRILSLTKHIYIYIFIVLSMNVNAQSDVKEMPEDFVYAKDIMPSLRTDLRYYSSNNFVGEPIDGYIKPKCILTKEAATALKKVQDEFARLGFGLLVFDAYRPQRAVDHFIRWSKDSADTKMKEQFYPNINKKDLFEEGYISEKSGHSRGSTVDITIVSLRTGHILDLGGPYDYFDKKSWVDYKNITKNQRAIRLMLQRRMVKHGFKYYPKEWWHFTLAKEPYPDTYFDFPVK